MQIFKSFFVVNIWGKITVKIYAFCFLDRVLSDNDIGYKLKALALDVSQVTLVYELPLIRFSPYICMSFNEELMQ